ncbi:putative methyltransferase-domain-containing protein, partial [Gilbertella persicaria]|uniref:putative methyltransferase-domain-containing protein n=1 Tax=Gilbertella persicaria TaxID=101096 RepID=UPI002220CAF2
FYYRLQRHSALYRILLSRPYSSEIHFNQWNRIDLKLVNEFGLTLTNKQKMSCWLEIDCRLLVNKDHRIQTCQDYEVFCRPIQKDGWESTVQSEIAGFQHDTEGNFEYMVVPPLSFNIFHAYCLLDQSYLIVKEDWKLGTSGKLWDSALVLSHMFCDKIQKNPFYFKDRRLLDLSAGTGCIGLLLASLLKDMYRDQPDSMPEITMTDLPEALDLIHQNRTYNHLEDYTHIMPLAWGNYEDAKQVLMKGPIHTIIASDVLYEPASFQKLVQTLDWLSTEGDVDIYLGYKRRGLSLEEELSFFNICSKRFHIRML